MRSMTHDSCDEYWAQPQAPSVRPNIRIRCTRWTWATTRGPSSLARATRGGANLPLIKGNRGHALAASFAAFPEACRFDTAHNDPITGRARGSRLYPRGLIACGPDAGMVCARSIDGCALGLQEIYRGAARSTTRPSNLGSLVLARFVHSCCRESRKKVTGPSLTSATCMQAPNAPVCTGRPSACASAATRAWR